MKIKLTPRMKSVFEQVEQAVCSATSLASLDPAATLSLAVNMSDSHVEGSFKNRRQKDPRCQSSSVPNYPPHSRNILRLTGS